MSTAQWPVLHVARLTLETLTPLSVSTGSPDGVFDTALVLDANGLPALPGTSLAGVLRQACRAGSGQETTERLFGYQKRGNDAAPSRVQVSWGCIQDSTGKPVEGLLLGDDEKRLSDPLLAFLRELAWRPLFRDRVSIGERGAARDTGKFDRAILPRGCRFSAEISLWSDRMEDADWQALIDLLGSARFRLGGGTRAGLGAIRVAAAAASSLDLRTTAGRTALTTLGAGLGDITALQSLDLPARAGAAETITLKLKARDFWRMGQGDVSLAGNGGKPADLLPKTEPMVDWSNGRGAIRPDVVVLPASSVKGALRHRFVFHHRRLLGLFAGETVTPETAAAHAAVVDGLFGSIKGTNGGRAGELVMDDIYLDAARPKVQVIPHNALDRFTGGVRDHMLFQEEMIWGDQAIELRAELLSPDALKDDRAREALRLTLEDLRLGRLALGAGTSKGHGQFEGDYTWNR